MNNRGFTLLELLGVIVILALLTTLVFPSILNTIKKSSDQTDKLSMDLISNAADLYIENKINEFIKFNGNKYIIEIEDLLDDGNLPSNIKITDIDNIDDKCIQVTYNDGFKYELKEKGTCEKLVQFSSICKLASDSTVTGINAGAKYNCKVDPNKDSYTFYVLTKPNGDTIDLIMDRNINSDGTPVTKAITKSNFENGIYNLVPWVSKEDYILEGGTEVEYGTTGNTTKGPITAMKFLQEATKNWKNVNKTTTSEFIDSYGEPQKMKTFNTYARMPYGSEVEDSNGSNEYLYEYLDGSLWEGIGNQPSNNINNILGYWLLNATDSGAQSVGIDYIGYVGAFSPSGEKRGIRPVINLPIQNSEKLPDEYQAVEYIESTGTQYIDTGIIPNQDTGFDITFLSKNSLSSSDGVYGSIMGSRKASKSNELQLTTYQNTGSKKGTLRYGTTENAAGIIENKINHIILKNKKYTNPSGQELVLSQTFESPVTLTVFALNNNGAKTQHGKVQLYSLKLYNGENLVRNFIPCYRKSDNVIGMYDIVNDIFYTNLGTGTFEKGNDI